MRGMDIDIAAAFWYLFRLGAAIGIVIGGIVSLIIRSIW